MGRFSHVPLRSVLRREPGLGIQCSAFAVLEFLMIYLWICVLGVQSDGIMEHVTGWSVSPSHLPPLTSQGWSLVPTPRPCSAGGAWAHLPQGRGCPVGVRHSICDRPHACRSVTLKTNKTHHDRSGEIMEERKSLFCFPAFWIRGPAFLFCSGPCELCSCSALLTRSLVVLNNYTDLFVCIRECC